MYVCVCMCVCVRGCVRVCVCDPPPLYKPEGTGSSAAKDCRLQGACRMNTGVAHKRRLLAQINQYLLLRLELQV